MPRLFRRSLRIRNVFCGLMLVCAFAAQGNAFLAMGQQHPVKAAGRDGASANAALLNRAKKRVQESDPQGALSLLNSADLHASNAGDIHALKGICLALLAQPVESAAEFDTAIALRPNDAPTYLSAGLAFASFNNLDRALDRLSTALKLDPNLPGARYNYALVLSRAGNFAESEKQTDLEIASKGPRAESLLDLWRLKTRDAYSQKKWQDTIDASRKTLELDPGNAEAYAALGEALFSLNRSEESSAALAKAEALDPANPIPHALLGKLDQDAGKDAQAAAEFEAAHRLRPEDQDVLYRLFRIESHHGDSEKARRLLAELKALSASQNAESQSEAKATALNNDGVTLEKQGDLAGALDRFDQAARTDVTNLVFQRNAALLLCRLGRTDEALRRLRDILSMDPDDAETLQILAVANELAARGNGGKIALPAAEIAR